MYPAQFFTENPNFISVSAGIAFPGPKTRLFHRSVENLRESVQTVQFFMESANPRPDLQKKPEQLKKQIRLKTIILVD